MKIKILTLLFTLAICQSGCNHQRTNSQSTQKKEEIREFLASSLYQTTIDSSQNVVSVFLRLYESRQFEEALDLYLSDRASFILAFKTTTERYDFLQEYIIPLIDYYKDEDEGTSLLIDILKLELSIAEGVIIESAWKVIPEHYGHLVSYLGQVYIEAGDYEEAIEMNNKIIEYLKKVDSPDSLDFGLTLYNKGYVYSIMGNATLALEPLMECKGIFEKLNLREHQVYLDCIELIKEILK